MIKADISSAAADDNHNTPLTRTLQQERQRSASRRDLALAAWYSNYVKEREAFKQVELSETAVQPMHPDIAKRNHVESERGSAGSTYAHLNVRLRAVVHLHLRILYLLEPHGNLLRSSLELPPLWELVP